MSTTHQLTNTEQRGFLTVSTFAHSEPVTTEGWFYLEGDKVIMRKIRGRNRFHFASLQTVIDFQLYDKATDEFWKDMTAVVAMTREGL